MAATVGQLREFDPVNSDWTIYKKRLENYFNANVITDDARKRVILLNLLSEEAYKLVCDLCLPEEPENKTYSQLIGLISGHFQPSLSVFASRYNFYTGRKLPTETAKEWAARLRNLATHCNFESGVLEVVLRDMYIVGYGQGSVQDRLMEEKKTATFSQIVDLAATKAASQPVSSVAIIDINPPDQWVKVTAGGNAPPNGLIGGRDLDGSPMFVGRAFHRGGLIPAKVIPTFRTSVSYGFKEIRKNDFEVEILCGENYNWVPDSDGNVPTNALGGCYATDGTPLFIGRVRHNGCTTIGKVQPRNGVCYIPFGGKELSFTNYEVLVKLN